jgi:hypothetical protein
MPAMDQDQALQALEDVEVVPCLQAVFGEARELLGACLDEGIPALLDRAPRCHDGGCGCAPKLELLVRPEDLQRVRALLERRWNGMLEREGTTVEGEAAADGQADLPCPACGTAAPLEPGACTGCGLQLG